MKAAYPRRCYSRSGSFSDNTSLGSPNPLSCSTMQSRVRAEYSLVAINTMLVNIHDRGENMGGLQRRHDAVLQQQQSLVSSTHRLFIDVCLCTLEQLLSGSLVFDN